MTKKRKERVVLYLESDIKTELTEYAKKERRSLSNWIENITFIELEARRAAKSS